MTHAYARLAALSVTPLLLLAGCGSAGQGGPGGGAGQGSGASEGTSSAGSTSGPSAESVAGSCASDAPALDGARLLTHADVSGDGTAQEVRLTPPGGTCGDILFAAGKTASGVQLAAGRPPVRSAYAVQVPGHDGQLVVTRSVHPRGGYQLRVYAAAGAKLVELTRGTEPLVPFVATDVQEQPLSIDCRAGGLVVTQAVAHEPSGVLFAWDVRRTTYTLDRDARLTAGPEREVEDNVLPAQLRKEWPELVEHTAFPSCRVR